MTQQDIKSLSPFLKTPSIGFIGYMQPLGFSDEAKEVSKTFERIKNELKEPYTYKEIKIKSAINKSVGYVTVNYLSKETTIETNEIVNILNRKNEFKKSFIKGSKGQDVYYIGNEINRLKDIFNTFRHINSKKY